MKSLSKYRTAKTFMALFIIALLTLSNCLPGMKATSSCAASKEYRAFWFSYYDYDNFRSSYRNTATNFRNYFTRVVKNGKNLGMNTIIVHVRPFSDAIYSSSYYPWSANISGKQGRSPGYDPLKIMTTVAHKYGLRIEAWINPYRVTRGSTSYAKLASNNPARKWHYNSSTKRNVLSYYGSLYYNPAKASVRKLIVNGAVEIIKKYNVDGIHMDDYFYPSFSSSNVRTSFDAQEYNKSTEKKQGKSIAVFRRHQVNKLVRALYKAIKKADPNATFGISPAGDPSSLSSSYAHYVDYKTWLKSSGYIDYICPQVYWGFKHSYCKFNTITNKWVAYSSNSKADLYLGVAVYKAGHWTGSCSAEIREWAKDTKVLKKQVVYGRKKKVDGFAFFDYSDLVSSTSKKAVAKLKTVLK